MFDFRHASTDSHILTMYVALFRRCFPKASIFTQAYLSWLYQDNPEGEVLGFDAWDGNRLCAHYACIPTTVQIDGKSQRALLSLNTATDPDYQGRGLFTQLAERTYQAAATNGYYCVYGVANANSTPGFLRKLGFSHVGTLDAKIGVGHLRNFEMITAEDETRNLTFSRIWNADSFTWRMKNPQNPLSAALCSHSWMMVTASAHSFGIRAYAELPIINAMSLNPKASVYGIHVFLGAAPHTSRLSHNYITIPKRLRPSPLNFIFRNLTTENKIPVLQESRFNFIDFDAY